MLNQIQFKHFAGTKASWEAKVHSKVWEDNIVFGKIWNGFVWEYKIYAGRVFSGSTGIDFLYELPTSEWIEQVDASINALENLVNIDGSSFTNQKFITAIENVVHNYSEFVALKQKVYDISLFVDDLKDEVEDISTIIHDGFVRSIETDNEKYVHLDASQGDVTLTLDIVDASNPEFIDDSTGIATTAYIEEKFDVINWRVLNDANS